MLSDGFLRAAEAAAIEDGSLWDEDTEEKYVKYVDGLLLEISDNSRRCGAGRSYGGFNQFLRNVANLLSNAGKTFDGIKALYHLNDELVFSCDATRLMQADLDAAAAVLAEMDELEQERAFSGQEWDLDFLPELQAALSACNDGGVLYIC